MDNPRLNCSSERLPWGHRDSVRSLLRRSLWRPAVQVAANLALYGALAATAVHAARPALGALCWPVLGLVLAGFLAAAHDCVHNTFLDSKPGNRLAGALWCAAVLVNFTSFKYPHLAHHRHTRVPGDTESLESLRSRRDYLRKMFWQNPLRSLLRSARATVGIFPPWIDAEARRRSMRRDAALVGGWLLFATAVTLRFPAVLLQVYWGPLLFFNSMVSVTALPEHHGCGSGPAILRSTRTVLSHPLIRMILWNGNFHVEHHLHPAVPSCNLPMLHRRMRRTPILLSRSYVEFHLRLLRQLRL